MDIVSKFANRIFRDPRLLWDSSNGTAIRVEDDNGNVSYVSKPRVEKKKFKPTEAQDNAIGRALRRRQNKLLRGWLPYAKR